MNNKRKRLKPTCYFSRIGNKNSVRSKNKALHMIPVPSIPGPIPILIPFERPAHSPIRELVRQPVTSFPSFMLNPNPKGAG